MGTHEKFTAVRTDDGTYTLFSEEYSQAMHTLDGAYREAVIKHVLPSKVLEKDEAILRVLEVGFGIGYNVLALVEAFSKEKPGRFLEVVSLERNIDAITRIEAAFDDENRRCMFELLKSIPEKKQIRQEHFSVTVLEGDARRTVQMLEGDVFQAIFHDPYSPSKNPELWTVDFFRELLRLAKDGCMLTTYSSAAQIRSALLEAGFAVGKGPGMGKKREGTIAAKGGYIEAFSEDEWAKLRLKKQSVPYRDPGLSSSREEILQRRREEMKRFRSSGY